MKKLLSLFFLFLFGSILLGQSNNSYEINVELIQEDKLLIINQKMILKKFFLKTGQILTETIILNLQKEFLMNIPDHLHSQIINKEVLQK